MQKEPTQGMTRGQGVGKGMWREETGEESGTNHGIYCLKEWELHLQGNAGMRGLTAIGRGAGGTPQHSNGETSDRTYQPGQMQHPDKPCSSEKSAVGNPTANIILLTVKQWWSGNSVTRVWGLWHEAGGQDSSPEDREERGDGETRATHGSIFYKSE